MPLSKNAEMQILDHFVDELCLVTTPYLFDIFITGGIKAQIEQAIRNDLGFVTIRDLETEIAALRKEKNRLVQVNQELKEKARAIHSALVWLATKTQEQLDNAAHITAKARDLSVVTNVLEERISEMLKKAN